MLEVNFEAAKARKISTGEEIPIPAIKGGDSYYRKIIDYTYDEEKSLMGFNTDIDGKPFNLSEFYIIVLGNINSQGTTSPLMILNKTTTSGAKRIGLNHNWIEGMNSIKFMCIFKALDNKHIFNYLLFESTHPDESTPGFDYMGYPINPVSDSVDNVVYENGFDQFAIYSKNPLGVGTRIVVYGK